ncbi:hypothetical protein SALBM135S_03466 [Streptomyces alboniger]
MGLGYLIAPQFVLTACHVIVDDTGKVWPRITAWVGHPPSGGAQRRVATACWTDPDGADAALLHLHVPVDVPGTVRWGRPLVRTEALPYSGLGYPLQTRAEDGQRLVEHLRGLGVMVVIGTGLSLSTPYPTSAGLTALLWDAIDADPEARALLAAELGQPDQPAKLLIGDRLCT